jgi:hypothetical protein
MLNVQNAVLTQLIEDLIDSLAQLGCAMGGLYYK